MAIDRWVSPDNVEYHMADLDVPSHLIIFDIVDSYNNMKLKQASKHRNGGGIENGIDNNTTFSLMAKNKFKINYQKYSALETIFAGATWPNIRVKEAYPSVSAPETDLHVYWQRPCNYDIDDEAIEQSNKYIDNAMMHAEDRPCLWLRGIMPKSYTHIPKDDIPDRRIFYAEGNVPPLGEWPSGVYYGDGSGGANGKFPSALRCGVSVVSLDTQHNFEFGIKYPLPGEIQTVPRAELSAMVSLAEFVVEDAIVLYIGDNLPVIKLFNKGEQICKTSTTAGEQCRPLQEIASIY